MIIFWYVKVFNIFSLFYILQRFNVAITRSKALLIIVGNSNLLQYEEYWRALINYCREQRCFTGALFQPVKKGVTNIELEMAKLNINDGKMHFFNVRVEYIIDSRSL